MTAVGGLAGCSDDPAPPTRGGSTPEPAEGVAGAGPDLVAQPEVVSSVDGVLALTLTAQVATVDIGAAQPVTTYTYDGIVPGRTWEVRPGDTLRITVDNQLPMLPGMKDAAAGGDRSGHDMMSMGDGPHDRPHEWTTTNLHTHGLHVSPKDNSDNPFISIAPGQEFDYEIAIPEDHVGGLHWYHPHRHGAVAQQVRGGMSGIIVVRGEIDEVPEVKAAGEEILVLQALELRDTTSRCSPGTDSASMPRSPTSSSPCPAATASRRW